MDRGKKDDVNDTRAGASASEQPDAPTAANPQVEVPLPDHEHEPCKSFRVPAGNDAYIEASVWPRRIKAEDRDIKVYSVTVRKNYRAETGEWANTQYFRGSEFHLVVSVLKQAEEWVTHQRRDEQYAS